MKHNCPEEGEYDDDCPACDEEMERANAYWSKYFGLKPGMTTAQRRAQLEAFKPVDQHDPQYRADMRDAGRGHLLPD